MPTEPPPTAWVFPDVGRLPADGSTDDLVGLGADLEPGTLLAAYRRGLFPMPGDLRKDPLLWFSPLHRGVLPLQGLKVSKSLRRSLRDFEIRLDTAFDEVVAACADPSR